MLTQHCKEPTTGGSQLRVDEWWMLEGSQSYGYMPISSLEEIRFRGTAPSQVGVEIPNWEVASVSLSIAHRPKSKRGLLFNVSLSSGLRPIPHWSTCSGVRCEKPGSTAKKGGKV